MQHAKIVGNATMAVGHPGLNGCKMLLCEILNAAGEGSGKIVVAVDWLGAGIGSKVMINADGDAVQTHLKNPHAPMRNIVFGIVDEMEADS